MSNDGLEGGNSLLPKVTTEELLLSFLTPDELSQLSLNEREFLALIHEEDLSEGPLDEEDRQRQLVYRIRINEALRSLGIEPEDLLE